MNRLRRPCRFILIWLSDFNTTCAYAAFIRISGVDPGISQGRSFHPNMNKPHPFFLLFNEQKGGGGFLFPKIPFFPPLDTLKLFDTLFECTNIPPHRMAQFISGVLPLVMISPRIVGNNGYFLGNNIENWRIA